MPKYGAYRHDDPVAYACGVFPCMELHRRRPDLIRALLIKPESQRNEGAVRLAAACRASGIYVEEAPRAVERICGKENCYAVAVFDKFSDKLSAEAPHVVLHSVSDAGNFGTIARTCLGFGFVDVAMIRPCVDCFEPKAVRASMGAVFGLRLSVYDSFEQYRAEYPAHSPYYFRLRNAGDLFDTPVRGIPALVFGNEGAGLPKELEAPDTGVRICHSSEIDSLNLSVAAGIGIAYFAQNTVGRAGSK